MNTRYLRQIQLSNFGPEAQQKLANASVLVVGAGGLGVPVLQYLTAMGVGKIGIVDGDIISISNLQRQVLYFENEVGKAKVNVAAEKLSAQNPLVHIEVYPEMLAPVNALEILKDYDVIVDATDNFSARYLINDACVMLKKPFVYGAIQAFEGQVSVFNYQNGPTYRCLFPEPPAANEIPDCNTNGVLGVVPGIIGTYQALEVVKIITGIGTTLSGILQVHDFLSNENFQVKLKANPANKNITQLQKNYVEISCNISVSLSVDELVNWYASGKDFTLVDIREPHEFEDSHLENARLIPVTRLVHQPENLDKSKPVLVVCQKGLRSQKAVEQIKKVHPAINILSLEGGMDSWLQKAGEQFLV